jgi:hypothetical protein
MMGKKRQAELIALRTVREQEWAYRGWLAHLTLDQMRALSGRPESEGGIGHELSPHAVKNRLDGYRERMREVYETNVELERSRIDEGYEARMQGYRLIVANPETSTANRLAAIAAMRDEDRERRKYLGLDKPVESRVEVVSQDAVTEELNAMLARMGRPPIKAPKNR